MGADRRGPEHLAQPGAFHLPTRLRGRCVVFHWRVGVHIEACRTVGELETCQGQASAQQVLGMLAWHAANVVPGLDIPTRWSGRAPPALLTPSPGRASSLSACGL